MFEYENRITALICLILLKYNINLIFDFYIFWGKSLLEKVYVWLLMRFEVHCYEESKLGC